MKFSKDLYPLAVILISWSLPFNSFGHRVAFVVSHCVNYSLHVSIEHICYFDDMSDPTSLSISNPLRKDNKSVFFGLAKVDVAKVFFDDARSGCVIIYKVDRFKFQPLFLGQVDLVVQPNEMCIA
ncbi:MAG: hypothetical protein AAF620_13235 [Bacteroidota bacterium]